MDGIYGIDLGLTYSVVACIDEMGRPVIVRNTDGDDTTPSVVYFETADNVVVGKTAKEAAGFIPDNVVSLIKREMGNKDYSRTFYGQELSPAAISGIILAALAKSAEEETHRPVNRVVITVPAYFGLLEKDATRKAGEIAGLDVIGIAPEPVAAALAYGMTGNADGTTFLVYDLGGGTFDVTLITMTDTSAQVLAFDGNHRLGGADWDARLFEYLKYRTIEQAGDDSIEDDEAGLHELRLLAENAKKALTRAESKKVIHRHGGMAASITVTRAQFEEMTSDLLEETIRITSRILQDAERLFPGVRDSIGDLLLVGGSSKMPAVAERLRREFPWRLRLTDPDLVVAKGAALYAAHPLRIVETSTIRRPDEGRRVNQFDEERYKAMLTVCAKAARMPEDLIDRYAITLPATDAEITAQVNAVRAYWNRASVGNSRVSRVAEWCRARDRELRQQHGDWLETAEWWQRTQAEHARKPAAAIDLDEIRPQPRSLPSPQPGTSGPYFDFDLLFNRTDSGYRVQVTGSPVGEGHSATFELPFSDIELELFVSKVGSFRSRKRRIEHPLVTSAKEAGHKLFSAAFGGMVGECLLQSLDRADQEQAALRIRLQFGACPELSNMPWELLYDKSEDRFLALSGRTPIIRHTRLPSAARKVRADAPLRILVIKSEPADYEPLDLAAEWASVSSELSGLTSQGLVSFTELTAPTLRELRRVLAQDTFHILHYMGHGGFDPRAGGTLVFTDEEGLSHPITADDLGVMLYDHRSMRLAVLNACEAGRTDATDPFAGVADTLVRRGIPAVVAMQFEVTDRAAIEFAPALYGALAAGLPVDAAVAEARKAVRAVSALEWATPVLYLRADDAHLFDITRAARIPETKATITDVAQDDAVRGPGQHPAAEPVSMPAPPAAQVAPRQEVRHPSSAKLETSEISLRIGLAGTSASGKSVLMRVLVKHLRETVAERFRADVRFATVTPAGYPGTARYQAGEEDPLYVNRILPAATPALGSPGRELETPVMLRWRQEVSRPLRPPILRSALMSFSDTAGDDLSDMNSIFRLHYLASCNALIVTIDPFSIPGARTLSESPTGAVRDAKYNETCDLISRITEFLRTELDVGNDQRISIPVAVVVTKIDIFFSAADRLGPHATLNRQSPLFLVPREVAAYDDSDGQAVHEHVRTLLHTWGADDVDIHMRLNYSDYRYFGVSALGGVPDYENRSVSAEGVHPHRVEDPVLWLMSRYKAVDNA